MTAQEVLRLNPNLVDYLLVAFYFVPVLGIGFAARRSVSSSLDFLLSGRSMPAWITGLAFISANLGAIELIGMVANGAQFGIPTVHYYWLGAIPAMVFLGIVMMPFYYGSKARSVPEFLLKRFNKTTQRVQAVIFAVASILIAGVNLFSLGLVLEALLGWSLYLAIPVAAGPAEPLPARVRHVRAQRADSVQRGAVGGDRDVRATGDPDGERAAVADRGRGEPLGVEPLPGGERPAQRLDHRRRAAAVDGGVGVGPGQQLGRRRDTRDVVGAAQDPVRGQRGECVRQRHRRPVPAGVHQPPRHTGGVRGPDHRAIGVIPMPPATNRYDGAVASGRRCAGRAAAAAPPGAGRASRASRCPRAPSVPRSGTPTGRPGRRTASTGA